MSGLGLIRSFPQLPYLIRLCNKSLFRRFVPCSFRSPSDSAVFACFQPFRPLPELRTGLSFPSSGHKGHSLRFVICLRGTEVVRVKEGKTTRNCEFASFEGLNGLEESSGGLGKGRGDDESVARGF